MSLITDLSVIFSKSNDIKEPTAFAAKFWQKDVKLKWRYKQETPTKMLLLIACMLSSNKTQPTRLWSVLLVEAIKWVS